MPVGANAVDGPAEPVEVSQPFLPGQQTRVHLEGSRFQPQAISSFSSSRNSEVDGEHGAVNLTGKMKRSLRMPWFPPGEVSPLFGAEGCRRRWERSAERWVEV